MTNKLIQGQKVPELEVNILDNKQWKLSEDTFTNMKLVVFYRGLHCPLCKAYIGELDKIIYEFSQLDIEVIAISGDSQEKAKLTKAKWGLKDITIGYNHSVDSMRQWDFIFLKELFPANHLYLTNPVFF